jgi:hypothetical protein
MATHDEPVEISVDGELIAGRFITPGTLIPGAPALYIDIDWDRPKMQLHREQELVGYRRSFVPAASNRALRACSEFAGDVLLIGSQFDDIVPSTVINSYREACKHARSLTYRLMEGADHGLSDEADQRGYTSGAGSMAARDGVGRARRPYRAARPGRSHRCGKARIAAGDGLTGRPAGDADASASVGLALGDGDQLVLARAHRRAECVEIDRRLLRLREQFAFLLAHVVCHVFAEHDHLRVVQLVVGMHPLDLRDQVLHRSVLDGRLVEQVVGVERLSQHGVEQFLLERRVRRQGFADLLCDVETFVGFGGRLRERLELLEQASHLLVVPREQGQRLGQMIGLVAWPRRRSRRRGGILGVRGLGVCHRGSFQKWNWVG